MLEYVYIETKKGMVKIMCQDANGTLPDFSVIGITQEEYEARLKKFEDFLVEEEKRKLNQKRYQELFYGKIDLFMEHYDEIVNEPKFANILLPNTLFGSMYVTFPRREITLGELLQIYKHEQFYTGVCPNCTGTLYITSFGFSPLSGSVFPTHRCFGKCREIFHCNQLSKNNIYVGCSGNHLMDIRNNYFPIESGVEPLHIAELLNHLGEKVPHIEGFYEDNSIGGMYLGKSKQMLTIDEIKKENYKEWVKTRNEKKQLISNIIVTQQAWTLGFVGQILSQNALYFGELPDRLKRNKAFLSDMINNTDWIPELGMISPKLLTAEACIRAINAYPYKRKRLLRLVPERLFQEVKVTTQNQSDEE